MESIYKTPDQLLPSKTIKQVLEAKPSGVLSVSPDATVFSALQLLEAKGVGFLVVLQADKLVGVLSERDYARKVILAGKSSKDTPVRDIMTEKVIYVTPEHTVSQCMTLMNEKRIRHLPVVDGAKAVGVLSIRDLMAEVIAHHERLICQLELERITMTTDSSSY